MLELARTIRFCISFGEDDLRTDSGTCHNTFASLSATSGLPAYYELVVRCRGDADATTGYLLNISTIDDAIREYGILHIQRTARQVPHIPAPVILRDLLLQLQTRLGNLIASITWRLTPFYSLILETAQMDRFQLSQQFSFAAAHRLHCSALVPRRGAWSPPMRTLRCKATLRKGVV